MSLFGSMLRDFDDPFFNGQREHMRRMERMMDDFMMPFGNLLGGGFGFPQLMAPPDDRHGRRGRDRDRIVPYDGGFGRSLFPDIGTMFAGMEGMANDPNCHMYSSSSVVSYSVGEDGQPKVYQASSSTRTAPGGVKETRQTMSDSMSGVQRMAIGHHLGERAHIVEKTQNRMTGQQEEAEEFINLEDNEANTFNEEWCRKTSRGMRVPQIQEASPPRSYQSAPLAITAGTSDRHSRKRDKDGSRIANGHPSMEKSRKTTHGAKHRHSSKPRHETSM